MLAATITTRADAIPGDGATITMSIIALAGTAKSRNGGLIGLLSCCQGSPRYQSFWLAFVPDLGVAGVNLDHGRKRCEDPLSW